MSFLHPLPSIPYRFASQLSDPSLRRGYLDAAGKYTQAASDVFVVVVFLYFNLIVRQRGIISKSAKTKSVKSSEREPIPWASERVKITSLTGQKETRGSVLLTSAWAIVIAGFALWRTGDDYLHITRSPAQVASALLGANLVFSLPFLRDYTPQLISFHRLQSVLIFGLLLAHAILYLNFYAQNNLLAKRLGMIDVQLGIALAALSVGLWLTGAKMQALKSRFGTTIGRTVHVALTTLFGIALWFHVAHSHNNLRRAGLVWAMGQVWRMWKRLGDSKHKA